MAGNSFDIGERKTHEINNSKPLASSDAFEGFVPTKRGSFTDRVKAHSGVHLDTPTSTSPQKQAMSEPEDKAVEQQAVPTPDFSDIAETQHHDWFEWVKQFRSVDTQPVARINGCAVVPSVKKVIACLARLGTFEQRIMLDALDLMTKDEHMTVVNSYYDSFATDANEGGYSHADDEDAQQYAQQLAESQQRERELQETVDSLRAELVDVLDRIEHEETRVQVDAGLKGTAADPHKDDDDSEPVIDGAADEEEDLVIDQPDERASQDAGEAVSDETTDGSAADSDESEPATDNASDADDESDEDVAIDGEDSDTDGFDDLASEMEDNANSEEDAAIAAQAAQEQQKAEAEAAAELEQERQAEVEEQAEEGE